MIGDSKQYSIFSALLKYSSDRLGCSFQKQSCSPPTALHLRGNLPNILAYIHTYTVHNSIKLLLYSGSSERSSQRNIILTHQKIQQIRSQAVVILVLFALLPREEPSHSIDHLHAVRVHVQIVRRCFPKLPESRAAAARRDAKPIAAPTTMPETAASPRPLHLESEHELLEADADSASEREREREREVSENRRFVGLSMSEERKEAPHLPRPV